MKASMNNDKSTNEPQTTICQVALFSGCACTSLSLNKPPSVQRKKKKGNR